MLAVGQFHCPSVRKSITAEFDDLVGQAKKMGLLPVGQDVYQALAIHHEIGQLVKCAFDGRLLEKLRVFSLGYRIHAAPQTLAAEKRLQFAAHAGAGPHVVVFAKYLGATQIHITFAG